jgi:hypothetical protein
MTAEQARVAAEQLVALMRMPLSALSPGDDPRVVIDLMRQVLEDPERVKQRLVEEMLSGRIPEPELREDLTKISDYVRSPRRILDELKELVPPGKRGRPSRAGLDKDEQLATLAAMLLPAIRQVLKLHAAPTKRTLVSSLKYLHPDFPSAADYLLYNLPRLERLLADSKLLESSKTAEGRAKVLAYVLAGEEFHINRTYALRRVRTAIFKLRQKSKA